MATGKTAARGYDNQHKRTRATWAPIVEAGDGYCHATHCLHSTRWIPPGTPWDLGHTPDRTGYTGPEHRRCNRSEGGRRARRRQRRVAITARRW
jgi:hypothetical protein